MFDNILRYSKSSTLKLGVRYPSFIFGIFNGKSGSLILHIDTFSGPPCEIKLNPKLFKGLRKTDTPSGTGRDVATFTDDSTAAPTLEPPPVAPNEPPSFPMDNSLVAHL